MYEISQYNPRPSDEARHYASLVRIDTKEYRLPAERRVEQISLLHPDEVFVVQREHGRQRYVYQGGQRYSSLADVRIPSPVAYRYEAYEDGEFSEPQRLSSTRPMSARREIQRNLRDHLYRVQGDDETFYVSQGAVIDAQDALKIKESLDEQAEYLQNLIVKDLNPSGELTGHRLSRAMFEVFAHDTLDLYVAFLRDHVKDLTAVIQYGKLTPTQADRLRTIRQAIIEAGL